MSLFLVKGSTQLSGIRPPMLTRIGPLAASIFFHDPCFPTLGGGSHLIVQVLLESAHSKSDTNLFHRVVEKRRFSKEYRERFRRFLPLVRASRPPTTLQKGWQKGSGFRARSEHFQELTLAF